MATLKICSTRTYWIPGIQSLEKLGEFSVLPPSDGVEPTAEDPYKAAHGAGLLEGCQSVYHVEFERGLPDNPYAVQGVALVVNREERYGEEPAVWLIPRRSGFLMSDVGATIDRI